MPTPARGLGRGLGPGRRTRLAGCKGRVQMRRWPGRDREPQPGGCGREGVARLRLERCARAARSPGRGGDRAAHSPSDRERRARRAVTGLGRAEPRRLSSKQRLRGRPAASSPRPALRSLAPPLRRRKWRRRRRARPTMPRAVTSPALAPPGGARGKLRPGWSVIPAPCGNLAAPGGRPRPGSLTRRAWRDGGGEGCPAAGPAPPRLAAGHGSRPPARPEGQACQLRLLLGLAQPPGTPAAGLTQQPAGGHAESVARPSLRAAAWELSRCRQTSPERPGGIAKG